MSESDPYLLGYRQAEQERLERQADELAHESEWLFDQIGVRAGWRVIEIGCGPRGCLGLLSRRVGSEGRVVGVERSSEQVGDLEAVLWLSIAWLAGPPPIVLPNRMKRFGDRSSSRQNDPACEVSWR
jgi:hypothetical protein